MTDSTIERRRSGNRPGPAPLLCAALAAALAVFAAASDARAQKVEIIPMVGYQSGATVKIRGGELNFEGSQNVGLFVDLNIWEGAQLEISYTRQDTKVTLSDSTGSDIFCDDERCYSKVESGALLQWDVALGLIVAI